MKKKVKNWKSGTKFRITNIQPDWYEMGVSKEDWNSGGTDDLDWNKGWVIDGRIWEYDENFCKRNEVVEQTWTCPEDRDIELMYETFLGSMSWLEGQFYQHYGLLVEDNIKVEVITEDEFEKITKNPISLDDYHKTLEKINNDKDKITLERLFQGSLVSQNNNNTEYLMEVK